MYSRLLKYSTEVISGATGAARKERGVAQNKRLSPRYFPAKPEIPNEADLENLTSHHMTRSQKQK